jgi:hypothetical protein
VRARVHEEARTGHEGGIVDVRRGDLANPRGARQLAHRAQVVGHVAHRRHSAVEVAAQGGLGQSAVRRGGQVLVAVDQAGQQVLAAEVDAARAGQVRGLQIGVRRDRRDPLALNHHRHVAPRRAAGPVDQDGVAIDGDRLRLGLRVGGAGGGERQPGGRQGPADRRDHLTPLTPCTARP